MTLKKGVRKLVELRGDEPRCVLCGNKHNLTKDHITSKKRGGGEHHTNQAILCGLCNVTKSDRSVEEMLEWYELRVDTFQRHLTAYLKLKRMLEKKDQIVAELRQLYKEQRYTEMKDKFYKNLFFIPDDKRKQIWKVINSIKTTIPEPKREMTEEDKERGQRILDFCVKELGCKIVEE